METIAQVAIDWHERVRKLHNQTIDGLAEQKYSELQNSFILQEWAKEDALNWHHLVDGLGPEGRVYLMTLSMKMRKENAVAAIFQADGRRLLCQEFPDHFHLSDPIGSPEWNEQRLQIIRAHGGNYANLPRNTWEDVIHTGVKGPAIQTFMVSTSYSGDADDRVIVGQTQEFINSGETELCWNMLPDWWG